MKSLTNFWGKPAEIILSNKNYTFYVKVSCSVHSTCNDISIISYGHFWCLVYRKLLLFNVDLSFTYFANYYYFSELPKFKKMVKRFELENYARVLFQSYLTRVVKMFDIQSFGKVIETTNISVNISLDFGSPEMILFFTQHFCSWCLLNMLIIASSTSWIACLL